MSRIAELQAEALLGDDARRFLESELGQAVLGLADKEKGAALVALCDVDPTDSKKIMEYQNIIARANSFAGWIADLIEQGREAETHLIEENTDDPEAS